VATFTIALKILGPVFFLVALLHLGLGLGADELLGANVTEQMRAEPTLDSQNRFYGVAFALYGAVLLISARDLTRYEPVLKATLYIFFLAGLSRIVSLLTHGKPAPLVIALAAVELVAPPILLFWLSRARNAA
jgi:hypothetical protein